MIRAGNRRRGRASTMQGAGPDRFAQATLLVAERAVRLGVPVSPDVFCATAVARLGVSGAALMVDNSPGWPETRHVTDARSARLAELHVTAGEGPCMDAWRGRAPVLVADLAGVAGQRRWPLFAPLAVEAGAGALFALPMHVGAVRVGVLALHRLAAGRLGPEASADAQAFAELAMSMLLDEQAQLSRADGAGVPGDVDDPEGRTGTEQSGAPEGAPLFAPQIHQATGMIAAQLGSGVADAFARLRAQALAGQRPLGEVAADVVARRLRFRPDGPGT